MTVTTLDPITPNDVTDLENAPFVTKGEGDGALKNCSETEKYRQACQDTPLHGSDGGSSALNPV